MCVAFSLRSAPVSEPGRLSALCQPWDVGPAQVTCHRLQVKFNAPYLPCGLYKCGEHSRGPESGGGRVGGAPHSTDPLRPGIPNFMWDILVRPRQLFVVSGDSIIEFRKARFLPFFVTRSMLQAASRRPHQSPNLASYFCRMRWAFCTATKTGACSFPDKAPQLRVSRRLTASWHTHITHAFGPAKCCPRVLHIASLSPAHSQPHKGTLSPLPPPLPFPPLPPCRSSFGELSVHLADEPVRGGAAPSRTPEEGGRAWAVSPC
jgi:hypothetical protein